jgi:hypothetical protein
MAVIVGIALERNTCYGNNGNYAEKCHGPPRPYSAESADKGFSMKVSLKNVTLPLE